MRFSRLSPEKKVKRGKVRMQGEAPYFSYQVTHAQFKPKESLPAAMGVGAKGYGYYNPNEIDQIDDEDTVKAMIVHEVMHLAFEHVWQPLRGRHHQIVNIAQDCVINDLIYPKFQIPSDKYWAPNSNGVIRGQIGGQQIEIENASQKMWQDVYDEIMEQLDQYGGTLSNGDLKTDKEQQDEHDSDSSMSSPFGGDKEDDNDSGQDDDDNQGSGSNPTQIPEQDEGDEGQSGGSSDEDEEEDQDEGDSGGNGGDEEEEEEEDQTKGPNRTKERKETDVDWGEVMAEAIQHGKQAGNIPAGAERRVEAAMGHEVSWRERLKTYVSKMLPSGYTFQRPSRHSRNTGVRLPGLQKGEKLNVIVSVDASGSISNELLAKFKDDLIEISRTYEAVTMEMFSHDTKVDEEGAVTIRNNNVQEIEDWTPVGGGGTDLVAPFKYAEQQYHRTDLMILLTDGNGPRPGTKDYSTRIPHIWVLAGDWKTTDNIQTGRVIKTD